MDPIPASSLESPARAVPLIGIAGPSASGKSTLTRLFLAQAPWRAVHLSSDSYYRDLTHLSPSERARRNFDCPAALETELMRAHLLHLAAGCPIQAPVYDFHTHTRTGTREVQPDGLVVVEGILLLAIEAVRPLFHLTVYLDTPSSICLQRRIERDRKERGRTVEDITRQYVTTVLPMMKQYVHPSKSRAGLVLDGMRPMEDLVEELIRAVSPIMEAFQERRR
ncbi:MAG TPA: uridine kinase [bacterium]|nr:uridine kinase [bacterium]